MTGACGTTAGYGRHRRAGTPTCQPCRDAMSKSEEMRRLRRARGELILLPAIGTQRRIRALMRLGWTAADLAEHLGCVPEHVRNIIRNRASVRPETAAQIDAVFRKLCMTPGPSSITMQRAERKGWAPPLAWDDIDDPNETPQGFGVFCESTHTEAGRRRAHSAYVRGDRSPASIAGEREYQRLRRRAKRAEKAS